MMLRMISAVGGTVMPSALSTARQLVSACTVVHTPQTRSVMAHASRGSRPIRIFSRPLTMVPDENASVMKPFSTTASTRRWPSIRVTGSTTMRAIRLQLLLIVSVHFRDDGTLANVGDHCVGCYANQSGDAYHGAHRVRRALDAETGERWQMLIERAVVPEPSFAAADAAVTGLNGIACA